MKTPNETTPKTPIQKTPNGRPHAQPPKTSLLKRDSEIEGDAGNRETDHFLKTDCSLNEIA